MERHRHNPHARGAASGIRQAGPLGKLFAALVGAVLLVLGLMFSIVIIAVAIAFGLVIWGWIWWKTRALRQQMRAQMEAGMAAGAGAAPYSDEEAGAPSGRVIEGEVIRADDPPPER
jgi:Flp pilus assembly protein TadB